MTNFSEMLSKAKAMQDKMKEAQDQIKKIEVEGKAGGDLVQVVLTGDYELKKIFEEVGFKVVKLFHRNNFSHWKQNIACKFWPHLGEEIVIIGQK